MKQNEKKNPTCYYKHVLGLNNSVVFVNFFILPCQLFADLCNFCFLDKLLKYVFLLSCSEKDVQIFLSKNQTSYSDFFFYVLKIQILQQLEIIIVML